MSCLYYCQEETNIWPSLKGIGTLVLFLTYWVYPLALNTPIYGVNP